MEFQADIVRFINHGSVDDNVESFLNDNVDTEDVIAQCLDVRKGLNSSFVSSLCCLQIFCFLVSLLFVLISFHWKIDITFSEIGSIESNAVNCCDFSSEGKLIATGGDDNKVSNNEHLL